jgi:peptide/nickel transport system substrate-binding protein
MEPTSCGVAITRRSLLRKTGALVGVAAILQACSAPPATPGSAGTAPAPASNAPTASTAAAGAPTASSAQAAAPAAGAPKRGGTLIAGVQNDWVRLDPIFEPGGGAGFTMLFDSYVQWIKDPKTGNWDVHPEMFSEWDLKPDQATFKVQNGIQFHDGSAWDAKAAKWNLDRLIFHPQARERGAMAAVDTSLEDKAELDKVNDASLQTFDFASKAVEVVDDHTLKIHLKAPMAAILATLGGGGNSPISPTAYQKAGKDQFTQAPVGAGPFRFSEWQPSTRLVLERNPTYWKMGADAKALPYIDHLTYRLIIDDSVRLLEIKSGNTQFMESVQGKDIAGVKTDPTLSFLDTDGQGISHRMPFDGKNPDSPFVKHPELRQALIYAIDRDAMGKALGFDAAIADKYMFPKSSFAYDDTAPFYAFDKAKAQQLVKDVLAKDPSVGGSNGKIQATLTVISRAVDRQQSDILAKMAGDVGFDLQVEILERAAFVAKLVQLPGKPGGNYAVSTVINPLVAGDPDTTLRQVYYGNGGQNYPHIGPFDDLIDKASATYTPAERKPIYREFMQKDYDLALMGYLWFQKYNWAFSKKLQNFKESPGSNWDFSDVWLEQ